MADMIVTVVPGKQLLLASKHTVVAAATESLDTNAALLAALAAVGDVPAGKALTAEVVISGSYTDVE